MHHFRNPSPVAIAILGLLLLPQLAQAQFGFGSGSRQNFMQQQNLLRQQDQARRQQDQARRQQDQARRQQDQARREQDQAHREQQRQEQARREQQRREQQAQRKQTERERQRQQERERSWQQEKERRATEARRTSETRKASEAQRNSDAREKAQVIANGNRGRATENKVGGLFTSSRKPSGYEKIHKPLTAKSGTRTIPDLTRTKNGKPAGFVEVKDVNRLSLSKQLRAQNELARTKGVPHSLVVGPQTKVSKPLQDAIRATNGKIWHYNSGTNRLEAHKNFSSSQHRKP